MYFNLEWSYFRLNWPDTITIHKIELSVLCVCLGISAILMGLLNAKMHFRHKLGLIHHPKSQEENYLCKSDS